MPVKRKCIDDNDNVSSHHAAPGCVKAANTGAQTNAAGRTQMLLLFGQRLQALEAKARKPTQVPVTTSSSCCRQCKSIFPMLKTSTCNHCAQALCSLCQVKCYSCSGSFCSTCSIFDYSDYETRSACFDCNR
ncbi:hypothetical protein COEREDRAFT_80667 [Coemansia reversa NRRL 1564]|uniref:Uncharacterized protein n=1 Tax=Coemansia reversa (strain ATCC 12441 / NRRL 1564) TaxID=763665 RepID=A0A2G5BE99_COERN|nr:hypothetical protein COEREDRAFT_80667 [Coemansia reversa NRRL 1564]|eukprot:PIA17339.1 hypothetical protein COEREDRAFT_80667 [Coemansia reversa NRRL 1564]